jgi:hypothetical protein
MGSIKLVQFYFSKVKLNKFISESLSLIFGFLPLLTARHVES